MARLRLDQVVKEFAPATRGPRPVRAVDRISLDIPDGELLTVLGPSGCGKTTLLRLIAGLESVTSGTIAIDGRDVTASPPQERDVAMTFQRDALLPHLSARENIGLGLRLRGAAGPEIAARVDEMARLLELKPLLDRRPGALSGGERQRVSLARALVRRPQALLLDEPFSSLDVPLRNELRMRLAGIHRHWGTTIVHVTHDQQEALALGHRVAVLHRGALQQLATPADLYRHPANAFVAGFIGSPPMNLWRGVLAHQGGALWFHAGAGADAGDDRLALCLIERDRDRLAEFIGKEITLGLPAPAFVDPREGRSVPYGSEIAGTVMTVEPLGAETLIQWSGAGSRFITRAPSEQTPAVGTTCPLIVDMSQAHYFDSRSGGALPPSKA